MTTATESPQTTQTPLSLEAANQKVLAEIAAGNPWYVKSQFTWANEPKIRRIYDGRYRFMQRCVQRAKNRLKRPLKALDLGCGDGFWLLKLSQIADLTVAGIDYNPVRVERTREIAPEGVIVLQADVTTFDPVAAFGEKFDVLWFSHVIEHIEDDVAMLKKVRGLLKDDGTLIIGTPNEGASLQQKWLGKQKNFVTDHVHFYTESEFRRKLAEAGFTVTAVHREVFFPGSYKLYYKLTKSAWGFKLLEVLTALWPAECSGYYFECTPVS